MDKGKNYEIKDIKLAKQGEMNIEIAESHMGALLKIKQRFIIRFENLSKNIYHF